jgi:7-cyano-7-deazaguanine synthase
VSQKLKACVLIYSGGLDSTVLLHELARGGMEVHALNINYGQRHVKERAFAEHNCNTLRVPITFIDLPLGPVMRGSSQTDPTVPVPHGHYEDESMRLTVVPNRNMIMLAVAGAHAISSGVDTITYAAHAGDHAIYPDCRREFVDAMRFAFHACHFTAIHLLAPYLDVKKSDIVLRGVKFEVDFKNTWSCYEGDIIHCGKCGTCVERKEAFAVANVPDPTEYGQ